VPAPPHLQKRNGFREPKNVPERKRVWENQIQQNQYLMAHPRLYSGPSVEDRNQSVMIGTIDFKGI
jgi:hypothetical protein